MDVAHAILLYGKIDFSRLTADYLSAKFELVIRSIILDLVLLINIASPDRHILIARLTKAELHERIAINAVRVQMHPRYHAQASLPFLSPAFFAPCAWRKNRG